MYKSERKFSSKISEEVEVRFMSLIMGKTSPPSALLTIFLYIIIKQIGTFIIQLFYIDFQKLDFIRGDSAPTTPMIGERCNTSQLLKQHHPYHKKLIAQK